MGAFPALLPAPKGGGFAMDDWWVWCGSAIRGEDGLYHLFASRWPKRYPFYNGYVYYSQIVRAVADNPLGPYRFVEVVLGERDARCWDGGQTHNPTIHRIGGRYCLFYQAFTFPGGKPGDDVIFAPARSRVGATYPAIGVAVADSPAGPWRRMDEPILAPRTGEWDREVVTNPAVCVSPEGRILLYYRSYALAIGLAVADAAEGPYRRVGDGPIPCFLRPNCVEDMYVWHNGSEYEMIAKDLSEGGRTTGEQHAGVHATSRDGIEWTISKPAKAYSRRIAWEDGTVTTQGCLERAQVLVEEGRPRALFAATGDGPGGFDNCTRTWNLAIPLAR